VIDGQVLAVHEVVPVARVKALATDVTALLGLPTRAALELRLYESALEFGGCTHDLTKEATLGVGRVVAHNLRAFGGLEHPDASPGVPGTGKRDLLDVKLTGQTARTMHD